jgi:two-component system, cell cycle sensor histidine kinase and response regulator CckA
MPQMLGNELAARMTELRPGLRVVYMSGYAQPVLTSSGGLDPDMVLVEKPFSAQMLLKRVGAALGTEGATAPHSQSPGETR